MEKPTKSVIYLSNVRLSFPHIAEPQTTVNKETGKKTISWSTDLLIPKNGHKGFEEFMKVYGALAAVRWKEKANQVMQMIHSNPKMRCYGDGDNPNEKISNKTMEKYAGYAGNTFIAARSDKMPQIVRPDTGEVVPSDQTMEIQQLARKFYGGCWVNVAISPWLQDNDHGKAVRCNLIAIQFLKDDISFAEAPPDVTGIFGSVSTASEPEELPSFMNAGQFSPPPFM